MTNDYSYQKKQNEQLDAEFSQASQYGKVKLGKNHIFWKKGLKWNVAELDQVSRIYRRIQGVDTKMCCGNVNFDIQKLVLICKDGTELELLIGDGMLREAEILYQKLKTGHPYISYGTEK